MEFLVLLGPPGSGKGTLSRLMHARRNWVPVSTGEEIRKRMADPQSEIGQQSAPFMDRGDYVPDALANRLFDAIVAELNPTDTVVLDGYPRTVPQAERLEAWLADTGHTFRGCLFLELDPEVARARMHNRRVCPVCRGTYPRVAGENPGVICEDCGIPLIQREDDDSDRMARRVRRHRQMTAPLRDWYATRGMLVDLDASRTPEELINRIFE